MKTLEQQTKQAAVFLIALGIACIVASTMSGCGQGPQGVQGPQGPAGNNAPTSSVDPDIQAIIDEYPTALDQGINCTVQQVTGGQWLSASSPGYNAGQGVLTLAGTARPYTLKTGFNQASTTSGNNSIVSSNYQYLLTQWVNYKVVCTGFLILTQAGIYDFDVNSDDGAILTVSGTSGLSASYTLNNDGNHAMTDKATNTGTYLYPGVYNFSIQYAQSGGGAFGLIVSYILNGSKSVIPGANFYH